MRGIIQDNVEAGLEENVTTMYSTHELMKELVHSCRIDMGITLPF